MLVSICVICLNDYQESYMKKYILLLLSVCLLAVSCTTASIASSDDELDLEARLMDGTYRLEKAEQSYLDTDCYELQKVRYSTTVVDETLQYMNIWIPSAYVNEDGTFNWDNELNGYTASTAPVIFRNNCSGWMSSNPENDTENKIGLDSYMKNGFIYVACGARSRDANNGQAEDHLNWGKAPAPIVDLKAGIRFLRANKGVIPGDTDKIITVGGSGAGQMSALLGASGDMAEYYPYLYELGAAGIEYVNGQYQSTISDSVFGSMVYYPITDLDNSDMAYAWVRLGAGDTSLKMTWPSPIDIQFTPFQYELEKDLAEHYIEYLNGLAIEDEEGKPLTLEGIREGSYYQAVLENLSSCLRAYLATLSVQEQEDYVSLLLSTGDWITVDENRNISITDIDGFIRNAGTGTAATAGKPLARNKNIPGFDSFSKDAENNAFGYSDDIAVHYSRSLAEVLTGNLEKYNDLMTEEEKANVTEFLKDFEGEKGSFIADQAYLMNPVTILKEGEGRVAKEWRIRSGTADQHASLFAVSYNLACLARLSGADVDYSLVWAMPHFNENEGYSTGTFVEWVNEITK